MLAANNLRNLLHKKVFILRRTSLAEAAAYTREQIHKRVSLWKDPLFGGTMSMQTLVLQKKNEPSGGFARYRYTKRPRRPSSFVRSFASSLHCVALHRSLCLSEVL